MSSDFFMMVCPSISRLNNALKSLAYFLAKTSCMIDMLACDFMETCVESKNNHCLLLSSCCMLFGAECKL